MKRIITLLCIISFTCLNAFCQVNLDSLWGIWNDNSQHDTIRLNAIYSIAYDVCTYSQADTAICFSQLAYDFSENKELNKHIADALYVRGVSYHIKGEYETALDLHTKSLNTLFGIFS